MAPTFFQRMLALRGDIKSADADFAVRRPDLADHNADGGAFARAVVAEQPEDFAALYFEVEVVNRMLRAEFFLDVAKRDHGPS